MRTLVLHDVPDSVYQALSERADRQCRPLEIEAVTILDRACRGRPVPVQAVLRGLEGRFAAGRASARARARKASRSQRWTKAPQGNASHSAMGDAAGGL